MYAANAPLWEDPAMKSVSCCMQGCVMTGLETSPVVRHASAPQDVQLAAELIMEQRLQTTYGLGLVCRHQVTWAQQSYSIVSDTGRHTAGRGEGHPNQAPQCLLTHGVPKQTD